MTPANCDPDNGGITLPAGFCAVVVSDSVGRARHIEVAANGDVLLALNNDRGSGPVRYSRRSGSSSGPGRRRAERTRSTGLGTTAETRFSWLENALYFATDDAVFRYPFPEGSTDPGRSTRHHRERPPQRSQPPGQEPGPGSGREPLREHRLTLQRLPGTTPGRGFSRGGPLPPAGEPGWNLALRCGPDRPTQEDGSGSPPGFETPWPSGPIPPEPSSV